MAGDFDVSGLNALTFDVGTLTTEGLTRARVALAKTAADIEADAKLTVPVDTGNLRASISRTVNGLTAEIGPTANYGAFVEFGTSRQGPAAYMGPAFDRNAGGLEQALSRIVG